MRKGDLELLEVRLEPLQTARDRHESLINDLKRNQAELLDRTKDLERDRSSFALSIDQGLASIRSLLQRANRAARDKGIIEDEPEPLTDPPTESNIPPSRPTSVLGGSQRRIL